MVIKDADFCLMHLSSRGFILSFSINIVFKLNLSKHLGEVEMKFPCRARVLVTDLASC